MSPIFFCSKIPNETYRMTDVFIFTTTKTLRYINISGTSNLVKPVVFWFTLCAQKSKKCGKMFRYWPLLSNDINSIKNVLG